MVKKAIFLAISCGLTIISGAACSPNTNNEQPPVETAAPATEATQTPLPPLGADSSPDEIVQNTVASNEATIHSVELLLLESFPVQVNAVIHGSLPDSCVTVEPISQQRRDHTFTLTVTTSRMTDTMCVEQQQPFEHIVSLDVADLPAGEYTVAVNGANSLSNHFNLAVDNVLPQEPPSPPSPGAIRGLVWNDVCRLQEDGSPLEGCLPANNGGYRADGVVNNNEPWIAGVEITLRSGQCPGRNVPLAAAITDVDGGYLFSDLPAGAYCVSIDPASEVNAPILLPGGWTYPPPQAGSVTVAVNPGDSQTANFGWEYQLDQAAVPEERETACLDQAAYVADVTIPDDTVLGPGEAFIKTWRVRNEGSCVWGPGYSLVFANAEQLGGPASVQFTQLVQPGNEIELSVSLVAPLEEGSYRGEWLLQNAAGNRFGSRGEYPFYVQIIVRASD